MQIELIAYAPKYIQKLANDVAPDCIAYAAFRDYQKENNGDISAYRNLRDRTMEIVPAVVGMAKAFGSSMEHPVEVIHSGTYLYHEYDFDAVGAEFVHQYKFIFA